METGGACGARATGAAGAAWTVGAAGAGAGAAGAVAAARRASTTRWASSRVMRPPEPVPVTSVSLMPFSASSLRTIGDRTLGPTPSPLLAGGRCRRRCWSRSRGRSGWRRRRGWRSGSRCCFGRCGCGLGCGRRFGRRHRLVRGRGRAGAGAVADHRQLHPDLDRLALGNEDLTEHARRRRRHLGVDLVRRDLEERLVPLDRIADRLHPAGDRPFGHRLAELRHHHVSQRAVPFRSTRAWSHRMSRTARGAAE